jgi:hypothetical protein
VSEPLERSARSRISQLGFVSECEQHLLALSGLAGTGDREYGVDRHVRRLVLCRRLGKGAVMADVATELREWYEDFARVRDDVPVRRVATGGRRVHEAREVATFHEGQRLTVGQLDI